MNDLQNRNIDYLRISITDRCNLRCVYCMPEDGITLLDHKEILSYQEIERLVKIFAQVGIKKIKVTGGEPLVRKDVEKLIDDLYQIEGIEDVTITTNGVLLKEKFEALYKANVRSFNISLDTLDEVKYQKLTRCNMCNKVIDGIEELLKYDDVNIKLNAVMIKDNEQDLVKLARYARDYDIKVRFIEMMPIGEGVNMGNLYEDDLLALLEKEYGKMHSVNNIKGNGPCHYYANDSFKGAIGFISSMTHKFCSKCNRLRLTCDGYLKPCLQYDSHVDLKTLLRNGSSDEEIKDVIIECIKNKPKCHEFEKMSKTDARGMSKIGG